MENSSHERMNAFSYSSLWQNGVAPTKSPQPMEKNDVTRLRGLPDYIEPGVRVLFVGINPGLRSAQTGHHFAGYGNRFWKLLYDSKLVSEQLTYADDARLLEWNLGLTNLIRRPSGGIDSLTPREYAAGVRNLLATVKRYRPRVLALLGVTIYRRLFPRNLILPLRLGWQREQLAGARLYLLPNPSGRNAHFSYEQMCRAYAKLRKGSARLSARKKGRTQTA